MYRKQVNAHSPLRILEESIHGGLGRGNLGVVMARAGVGKTACLVQIALDDLMREKPVLHIALEQTVEHVQSWYDALFEDMAVQCGLQDEEQVRQMVGEQRVIHAFADRDIWPERLDKTVESFRQVLDFRPQAIVVDGYNWAGHSLAENAAMIGALKAYAKMLEAELWMSAQTHREGAAPTNTLPAPCSELVELIDVAIYLEPHGKDVALRILKDHDNLAPSESRLTLHPDTLRLELGEEGRRVPEMPPTSFTLLSGGATGAEQLFGECAEKWGLVELNFTFEGRTPPRTRGLVRLTDEELSEGAVSPVYVQAHMHRQYPNTPRFTKTLQSIWHQVNTAQEVFVVGVILADGTVKGGTGWAAELARVWHKPVFVFDQEKCAWFTWNGSEWTSASEPTITTKRFAGTGTRFISEQAKLAITALFERSFGPAELAVGR